ncbi:MAG: DUF61 family protein [Methanomassiliicoccaceae archaeon]|jgi:uncharacterized protein (UPF0216 family)|nr:DUF61 family protein [Methanomassiliicoccaceae archaeon]
MDVEHLLSDINAHAPVQRRTLAEHTDSGDLTYRTRSGHTCEMTEAEIDILSKACAEREKISLRLPIIVTTDTSSSQGAWKVEGRTEVSVVSKLLSKSSVREDLMIFYHPHLRELQRMLPNSVMVLFIP